MPNTTKADQIAALEERINIAVIQLPYAERNYRSEKREIQRMQDELNDLKNDHV